jgi:hypothetical protein
MAEEKAGGLSASDWAAWVKVGCSAACLKQLSCRNVGMDADLCGW